MHLAILSDIHANSEALQAVLENLASRFPVSPPRIVCLGDMVGYGAEPEAVVTLLRQREVLAVMGNHELGVVKPGCRRFFNPQARQNVAWTAAALSGASLAWLAALPFFLNLSCCRMVHGLPPDHPTLYLNGVSDPDLASILRRLPQTCCFVGHTHRLGHVSLGTEGLTRSPLGQGSTYLAPHERHLINAGAVGQPRDGDIQAKYCLFDTSSRLLEVCFVPYDANRAGQKILDAGLPAVYARRLGLTRQ